MRTGSINQAMLTNNQLLAGCEPLPLLVLVVLSLAIPFIGFDVDFGKGILAIIFFLANYWALKSVAKYDPHFFRLIWPAIKRGLGTKIMLAPTGEVTGPTHARVEIPDTKTAQRALLDWEHRQ